MNYKKLLLPFTFAVGFLLAAFGVQATFALDKIIPGNSSGFRTQVTLLSATTTTATSTNTLDGSGSFSILGAKKVTFYFSRGDTTGTGNTGASTFYVDVTPDGTNWYQFNKLSYNVATSVYPEVFSSVALAGTSTAIASMDLSKDTFFAVRARAVETTDGEHTAKVTAEF